MNAIIVQSTVNENSLVFIGIWVGGDKHLSLSLLLLVKMVPSVVTNLLAQWKLFFFSIDDVGLSCLKVIQRQLQQFLGNLRRNNAEETRNKNRGKKVG